MSPERRPGPGQPTPVPEGRADRSTDPAATGLPQQAADSAPPPPPTPDHDDTGLDLARAVTRSLRAAGRGRRRSKRQRRTGGVELSGARPDGRDPAPLGLTVDRLVTESGWVGDLAVHGVFVRWAEIVGDAIADHCKPESLADGKLRLVADSTTWATELRLHAPDIVRRVNEELGHDSVRVVDVAGPGAPSWVKGRRTVRGGRGPRDTYG